MRSSGQASLCSGCRYVMHATMLSLLMRYTVQQGKEIVNNKYSKQKMILGTHTSEGEQNYLMIAEVGCMVCAMVLHCLPVSPTCC